MYHAIFGKTYSRANPSEVFAAAVEDGFAGIQFNLALAHIPSLPETLPDGLAEQIGVCAKKMGLRIAALSGTYNMVHPDPVVRATSRSGFLNVVEAARRMGATVVTLCTGSRNTSDMWKPHPDNETASAWVDLRGELEFALGAAEAANIMLGVEPEPGNVVRDAKVAHKLLTEVNSSRLGIILDAANLLSAQALSVQDRVIQEAADLLGGYVLLAHAKDIDASGHVVAAGEGAVHLKEFVIALRTTGFDGALIGHCFGPERAKSVAMVLSELIEATE